MEHIATQLPSSPPESTPENFSQIELTEQEQAEALRLGREAKYYRLREQAYWENVSKARELVKFTAEQLYEKAAKTITIDAHNEWIVKALCLYFTADKRFENLNQAYSLHKGIYLFGNVGVGKTFLMELFFQNQHQSYAIVSARQIEADYAEQKDGGDTSLAYYSQPITIPINGNPYGHSTLGICIDDVGTESDGKHYGKIKNVITEVILNRYDNRLPGNMTHVTTNLNTEEIEQRYGTRVRDRMREMFNLLAFNVEAPSRRK